MKYLYFLAIVPPEELGKEITKLKEYFWEQYQSKASLRSPPHITLHMPFKWEETKKDHLIKKLHDFAEDKQRFELLLQNFDAFPPRVIFIDVPYSEPLFNLQKELSNYLKRNFNLFNANYKEKNFHPHVTLAFRDLKKKLFFEAWEEFHNKNFVARFVVKNFCLLKHDGKVWQIYKAFDLK
jgi:2'-5' RNA ligase